MQRLLSSIIRCVKKVNDDELTPRSYAVNKNAENNQFLYPLEIKPITLGSEVVVSSLSDDSWLLPARVMSELGHAERYCQQRSQHCLAVLQVLCLFSSSVSVIHLLFKSTVFSRLKQN